MRNGDFPQGETVTLVWELGNRAGSPIFMATHCQSRILVSLGWVERREKAGQSLNVADSHFSY